MTVERPIKELLQIMVDNIELLEKYGYFGFFDMMERLLELDKINWKEADRVINYIREDAHSPWNFASQLQPRLEWLNEQIAKL